MGKKKKKMTPAQAAAARRDDVRRRPEVSAAPLKDGGPKDRGMRTTLGITAAIIAVVVVLSLVYTVGPLAATG